MLVPGDTVPAFTIASSVNPTFVFDTAAGRYLVLSFFGSSKQPFARRLLEDVQQHREVFDVTNKIFIGISVDTADRDRLRQEHPGIIYFWDDDRSLSCLCDAFAMQLAMTETPQYEDMNAQMLSYRPRTVILDPALRVIAILPYTGDPATYTNQLFRTLEALPPVNKLIGPAPTLVVPAVFEPRLCRALIDYYCSRGGEDSGFVRDVDGKTVTMIDHGHKRRADCVIEDEQLLQATQERLKRRLIPAIRQAFHFNVTRIERYIVSCYDGAQGGYFRAHRDNTTAGTAHRRFAVTLNLNAEEYNGGDLSFPEFGSLLYRAPTGGAVVFSCSLLHEAKPVIYGRRYAFLPFLYDEASAKIREANLKFIAPKLGGCGIKRIGVIM